jgi:hypothetical protein
MKTHIIIPALASLALFAANAASASTPTGNAPRSAKVEKSAGDTVSAKYGRQAGIYETYEMHGGAARVIMANNYDK